MEVYITISCKKFLKNVAAIGASVKVSTALPIHVVNMGNRRIERLHPAGIVDCTLYEHIVAVYVENSASTTRLGQRKLRRFLAFMLNKKLHAVQFDTRPGAVTGFSHCWRVGKQEQHGAVVADHREEPPKLPHELLIVPLGVGRIEAAETGRNFNGGELRLEKVGLDA